MSETAVQAAHRLAAAKDGFTLWRNNVGVMLDKRGVPVRYGLANESKAMNERLKSADLIGWRSFIITPEWVGHRIAQFVSHECKAQGWSPANSGGQWEHEEAQRRWAALVREAGGDARFISEIGGAL